MSATERVINDLNVAKLILCNSQMLTPEMCITIGQAVTSALAILKAQEPRVMTLDEVRAAEVVWLEQVRACVCAIKIQNFDSGTMSFAYAYNNYTSFVNIKPEYYGKVSRCWTTRPDEKVRAETPWVDS